MRFSTLASYALVCFGLLQTSALAVAPGTTFNGWTYECRDTDATQICTFAFLVGAAETRSPLAKITLGRERSTDEFILGALLPLGIAIGQGISAQLDAQPKFNIGMQTCVPTGCLAAFKMAPADVRKFANADTLTLTFAAFGHQEATVLSIPLSGIRDAIAAGAFDLAFGPSSGAKN